MFPVVSYCRYTRGQLSLSLLHNPSEHKLDVSQPEHSGRELVVTFRLRQQNLSDRHLVMHTSVIRVTFLPDAHTHIHDMLSLSLTPVQ